MVLSRMVQSIKHSSGFIFFNSMQVSACPGHEFQTASSCVDNYVVGRGWSYMVVCQYYLDTVALYTTKTCCPNDQ